MKISGLKLSYPHPNPQDATGKNPCFRVEQVTDAVDPLPGQYFVKREVEAFTASKSWKVTIIPAEIR